MASGLTTMLIALTCAGAAYFVVEYLLTRTSYRRLAKSKIQLAYMAIEEAERSTAVSWKDRVAARLSIAGWSGGLTPILIATGFLYAICVVVLSVLGVNDALGVFAGLPVCAGVVYLIVIRIASRRNLAFQRQLMPALGMLAAQIEAGNGAERAIEQILPALEDPLGAELGAALASTVTMELVQALRQVEIRYPSRSFTLFLAALEIDRLQGGALAPALREASQMLQRQFDLAEEAQAEVSQAKMEFYAVGGIVGLIAFSLLSSDDPFMRDAYTSSAGIVALVISATLIGTGVLRAMRLLKKAKEGAA